MAITDVLFRKPEALRLAELRLIQREDDVFRVQEGEMEDLRVHVRADAPRHELLKDRVALSLAMTQHMSNRNLLIITLGLGAVLAKVYGVWDGFFKVISAFH